MRVRVVLGLAVAALAIAACGGGGGASPSSPAPPDGTVASPSSTVPVQTPTPTSGPNDPIPLVEGDPVALPAGVVLYYYGGRVPIEGVIPSPMLRARQTRTGLEIVDLSAFDPDSPGYTQVLDFGKSRFARGLCIEGACTGLGFPREDSVIGLAVSLDGGITWQDQPPLPRDTWLAGFLADGQLLLGREDPEQGRHWLSWPEQTPVAPPLPDLQAGYVDGALLWVNQRGAIFNDAGTLIYAPPLLPNDREYSVFLRTMSDVVVWIPFSRDGAGTGYISKVDPGGILRRTVKWQGFDLDVIGRIDADRVIVRRYHPPSGGIGGAYILDFRTGELSEIEGLRRDGDIDAYPVGLLATTPVRPITGFAVVDTGGECLNVRELPSTEAPVLGCFADGVLLQETGGAAAGTDGGSWQPLQTPDGRPGFASSEFLVR